MNEAKWISVSLKLSHTDVARKGVIRCKLLLRVRSAEAVASSRHRPFLGALPEHAGIALERHKRLAGIGPVLLLLEGDVIDRLAASAALKEGARNIDHVP